MHNNDDDDDWLQNQPPKLRNGLGHHHQRDHVPPTKKHSAPSLGAANNSINPTPIRNPFSDMVVGKVCSIFVVVGTCQLTK